MVKTSTLMSWFIIIIMVGSIFGFAFYYVSNNPSPGTGQDQNIPPLQDTTKLQFSASGIDANVIDSLPSILIVAETNEAEINLIDSEIYLSDQNIRQVASSYLPPQSTSVTSSKSLIYRAEISLAPHADPLAIIQKISSDSNYLSNVQAVKSILVSVPKQVAFRNTDLNLDNVYEFKDTTVQAFAAPQTLIGDNLRLTLNATFQGQELTAVSGFEQENLSDKLLQKTISLSAPVYELEPTLLVSSQQVSFSNIAPISALVKTFKLLPDVNDSAFSIPEIQPQVMLSVSGLGQNQVSDLNALVSKLPDLNSAQTQEASGKFSALLSFKDDLNSLVLQRNSIVDKLREMNVSGDNIQMQESRTTLFGTVSLKKLSAAKDIYGAIGTGLLAKGVLVKIYQPAKLRVYQFADPNTNQTIEVQGQSIDAEVTPTHSVDENVSVQVQLALQRGKLVYAQALELQ